MGRKGDPLTLDERIHGAPVLREPTPLAVKHCRVTDRYGRLPGLLLEWRRTRGMARAAIRPALEDGDWIVVEEWMAAELLDPA